MKYNKGEVWFVEFPIEEDNSQIINRPVVVLDENLLGVLSVKITKHAPPIIAIIKDLVVTRGPNF